MFKFRDSTSCMTNQNSKILPLHVGLVASVGFSHIRGGSSNPSNHFPSALYSKIIIIKENKTHFLWNLDDFSESADRLLAAHLHRP